MNYVYVIWTGLYVTLTVLSVVALVSAAGWVAAFGPTFYGGTAVMSMLRGCRSASYEGWEHEAPRATWKQYSLYAVPLTFLFWPTMIPALLGRWQLAISVCWLIVIGMHLGRYVDGRFYG